MSLLHQTPAPCYNDYRAAHRTSVSCGELYDDSSPQKITNYISGYHPAVGVLNLHPCHLPVYEIGAAQKPTWHLGFRWKTDWQMWTRFWIWHVTRLRCLSRYPCEEIVLRDTMNYWLCSLMYRFAKTWPLHSCVDIIVHFEIWSSEWW